MCEARFALSSIAKPGAISPTPASRQGRSLPLVGGNSVILLMMPHTLRQSPTAADGDRGCRLPRIADLVADAHTAGREVVHALQGAECVGMSAVALPQRIDAGRGFEQESAPADFIGNYAGAEPARAVEFAARCACGAEPQ